MFNVGDKIVYPMHGAGTIKSIEEKDILGEKQSYYILEMPGEVKVMVPTAKALFCRWAKGLMGLNRSAYTKGCTTQGKSRW